MVSGTLRGVGARYLTCSTDWLGAICVFVNVFVRDQAPPQNDPQKQPGRILVPHAINTRRSVGRCPHGYRPSPRLRRLTQGARVFPSRFPGVFPAASLFLAILLSWHFAFQAILLSWRFAFPGDSRLAIPNMPWRAVVWSYFNFNSKSVPGCFWRPRAV